MKYRITEEIEWENRFNKETKLYEPVGKKKYKIQRFGRFFGFSHMVGDWMCDSQGNTFCCTNWFESQEQAKSYLPGWHLETYGPAVKCILDGTELELPKIE